MIIAIIILSLSLLRLFVMIIMICLSSRPFVSLFRSSLTWLPISLPNSDSVGKTIATPADDDHDHEWHHHLNREAREVRLSERGKRGEESETDRLPQAASLPRRLSLTRTSRAQAQAHTHTHLHPHSETDSGSHQYTVKRGNREALKPECQDTDIRAHVIPQAASAFLAPKLLSPHTSM